MATGLELSLARLRARQQPRGSNDGDSNTDFVSMLKRSREKLKRDHPLPPLPSGAADAASKRQHVGSPSSPGQPPADTPARPPPYELVVESPDGDMQSCIVDPALPLRDTLLCLELSPCSHLCLDGDRLNTAQSASDLGLARGTVLQAFEPQTGGGYEDGDEFEAALEAEQEMEAERVQQRHGPRRRRRAAVGSEDEDGAINEGAGEGAPRRRRQRVAAESEDDEPNAGEAEGREEQEDAAGGVAMGNGRPDRREEGETLVARIMALGEVQSCETAAAVLSVGSGSTPISAHLDAAEMVRAKKAYKWLAERTHPDKLQGCSDATAAFQVLGAAWSLWQKHFESRGNAGDDVDCSDGEGVADQGAQQAAQQAAPANEQQARQAQRQTKAQEASDLAAKFQEQQRGRVHAPAIAESGMLPWVGMSVEVAQLDEFKV